MTEAQQVAAIILQQLKVTQKRAIMVMSWGAKNFVAGTEEGNHFLQFNVNGMHFKGKVRITLMPNDTYKVDLIKKNGDIEKTLADIYFDNITEVIDGEIEYIKDYSF